MKTLITNLNQQVARLEQKVKELNATAKASLNHNNRVSALSALRSKKLAEHNLKQRSDTLNQLEEVYNKIEQAADQVEIVRAMESSTGVLRSLHAQTGRVERVEDVVEELREEMSKVDEIGNIINETGPVIDEGEIDDELEALENQARRVKEEKEAEATRQKLARLDSTEQAAQEAARKLLGLDSSAEAGEDSLLAESIGKLSHMSLEDRTRWEDSNHLQRNKEHVQPGPAE
jgi:charged multivesicular body protein 7